MRGYGTKKQSTAVNSKTQVIRQINSRHRGKRLILSTYIKGYEHLVGKTISSEKIKEIQSYTTIPMQFSPGITKMCQKEL